MTTPVILKKDTCLPQAERLVVLMPEYPVDVSTLGRIVRDLALHRVSHVLFLSVVKEPFAGVHMAHVLGYLNAVTHDPFLHADIAVIPEKTWIQAVRSVCRPGDLFLVLSDHQVRWGVVWHRPIAELITKELNAPVYVLMVQNGMSKDGR
jgi:hypothetical protein